MAYNIKDIKEAAIGGFSAVLLFFAIRQGDALNVDPRIGAIIGGFWLLLLYSASNKSKDRVEHHKHFFGNIIVTVLLTGVLTVAFKMGTFKELFTLGYFGSAAWISVWIAMPVATLFDLNNFTDILSRYYVRGRKK